MNRELRAASEMKESGVEWIGRAPVDWKITKISNEYDVQLGKMLGSKKLEDAGLKDYLRAANVLWGKFDLEEVKRMYILPFEKEDFAIRKGDLLVCEGGDVGRAAVWEGELEDCYIQNSLHRIRPRSNNVSNRYLYYILYTANSRGEMEAVSSKATIAHYTLVKIKRTKIPIPPKEGQEKIIKFLDPETSKIQKLIEAKTKQIQLLQEYEKSLIHHAVTKGLDLKAKMKDSGVEWIGIVPETWRIRRLKSICTLVGGGTPSKDNYEYWDGSIPWATPTDFQENPGIFINITKDKITPKGLKESSATLIPAGAVIMCSRASIGDTRINVEPITTNQGFCSFICTDIKNTYLRYAIDGFLYQEFQKRANKSTFAEISRGKIGQIKIALPPNLEQEQIVKFLDTNASKIHETINKIETQISKLEEYRKSLIYEIVTGKVKVS